MWVLQKELAAAHTQSSLDLVACLQSQHACETASHQIAALFGVRPEQEHLGAGLADVAAQCVLYRDRLVATQHDITSVYAFIAIFIIAVVCLVMCSRSMSGVCTRPCQFSLFDETSEFPRVKAKSSC